MQKVLISLIVPEQSLQYDLFVPMELPVKMLVPILLDGIASLTGRKVCTSGKEMLILKKANAVLHPDKELCRYPVLDGDTLILL